MLTIEAFASYSRGTVTINPRGDKDAGEYTFKILVIDRPTQTVVGEKEVKFIVGTTY
jgi:hypothetical protein